jgi:mediator of RNA polymerase II transcription subunit 14
VEFSALVSRAAEDSFLALKELVEKEKTRSSSASAAGDTQSDTERKINLLKYIVKTQQRMLRLNVLAKWCQQVSLSLCVVSVLIFLN